MSKDRLSRHEMKEDAFVEKLMAIKEFSEKNKQRIVVSIISVLVIFLIGYILVNYHYGRKEDAKEALGRIEILFLQNKIDEAVPQAEELIKNFDGTGEAGYTLILLGNSFYSKGVYDRATQYYSDYLSQYADNDLYTIAAYEGLGNTLIQQGKHLEAIKKFEEAVQKYPTSYSVPFLFSKIGDCYRATKDNTQASVYYQKIVDNYPDFSEISRIKVCLGELGRM